VDCFKLVNKDLKKTTSSRRIDSGLNREWKGLSTQIFQALHRSVKTNDSRMAMNGEQRPTRQNRQYTCNVIWRRVRETIFQWQSNKYYIL